MLILDLRFFFSLLKKYGKSLERKDMFFYVFVGVSCAQLYKHIRKEKHILYMCIMFMNMFVYISVTLLFPSSHRRTSKKIHSWMDKGSICIVYMEIDHRDYCQ